MEFGPNDILNVLRDEGYQCTWILTTQPVTLKNYEKSRESGIRIKVSLNNAIYLEIKNVIPYLEEVIDRFESEGYYLDYIQSGVRGRAFNDDIDMSLYDLSKKYKSIEDMISKLDMDESEVLLEPYEMGGRFIVRHDALIIQFEKGQRPPEPTKFQKIKNFFGFNESLNESISSLKFIKQPVKKGAKTEVYNVVQNNIVIGQIKWSSRMRGYGFLPSNANTTKVKNFTADLMKKWREKRKNEK